MHSTRRTNCARAFASVRIKRSWFALELVKQSRPVKSAQRFIGGKRVTSADPRSSGILVRLKDHSAIEVFLASRNAAFPFITNHLGCDEFRWFCNTNLAKCRHEISIVSLRYHAGEHLSVWLAPQNRRNLHSLRKKLRTQLVAPCNGTLLHLYAGPESDGLVAKIHLLTRHVQRSGLSCRRLGLLPRRVHDLTPASGRECHRLKESRASRRQRTQLHPACDGPLRAMTDAHCRDW